MDAAPAGAANTHCRRCGTRLGSHRTVLYRTGPGRPLRPFTRRLRGGLFSFHFRRARPDTVCPRCGSDEAGQDFAGGRVAPSAPKRLLLRFSQALKPRRRYLAAEGSIDLAGLVAHTPFPVFGLRSRPLGLRLRELTWDTGRGGVVDRVTFAYTADAPGGPRWAMRIEQGPEVADGSDERRHGEDLLAVESLVSRFAPTDTRQAYLGKGNLHRDWNLERIGRAPRRHATVHIGGTPAEVELAYWWRPQQVTLARLALGGHRVMAGSVGISHVRMLSVLKTMVALRQDADALAEHSDDYLSSRRPREGRSAPAPG